MHTYVKKLSIGLPALLFAVTVLSVSPASAIEGSSTTESEVTTQTTTESSTKSELESRRERTNVTSTEAKEKKRPAVSSEKRDEKRVKRCEGKKLGVQKRFANIVNKSQKIHDKITTISGRGTTFVTTNNLTPVNYDTLVAAADAAKLKSQASIDALEAATPTIDCTATEQTTTVAGFMAASVQVKTDLKAYRTAVKAVFVSIRAASEATDTDDDTVTTPTTPETSEGTAQ